MDKFEILNQFDYYLLKYHMDPDVEDLILNFDNNYTYPLKVELALTPIVHLMKVQGSTQLRVFLE